MNNEPFLIFVIIFVFVLPFLANKHFNKLLHTNNTIFGVIESFFKNWSNLKGRTNPAEFILVQLLLIPIGLIIGSLIVFFQGFIPSLSWTVYLLLLPIMLVPQFALLVRRLHDSNLSAWVLLYFPIFVIIYRYLSFRFDFQLLDRDSFNLLFMVINIYLFCFRGSVNIKNKYK